MQIWVWYEIQCINSDNLGELIVSFLCLSIIMTMATSSRRLSVKPDRQTKSSVPRHSSSVCSRWEGDGAFYTASCCVLLKLQVLSCAYPLTPMHSCVAAVQWAAAGSGSQPGPNVFSRERHQGAGPALCPHLWPGSDQDQRGCCHATQVRSWALWCLCKRKLKIDTFSIN